MDSREIVLKRVRGSASGGGYCKTEAISHGTFVIDKYALGASIGNTTIYESVVSAYGTHMAGDYTQAVALILGSNTSTTRSPVGDTSMQKGTDTVRFSTGILADSITTGSTCRGHLITLLAK